MRIFKIGFFLLKTMKEVAPSIEIRLKDNEAKGKKMCRSSYCSRNSHLSHPLKIPQNMQRLSNIPITCIFMASWME